ncbi:MAG: LamG domain-containing protein [Lentisphaerae bacterium]|nr:LamG domain-containing protein [Lentisphaerota bacterium]
MKKICLYLICLFSTLTAAAVPLPGEIAHYPMREGTGNEVFEAQKRLPAGKIRKSFWTLRDNLSLVDFGGMKSSVEASVELPEINFEGDFTIAVWVNAYWWKNNWACLVYRSDDTYGLRGNLSVPGQLHFRVKEPGVKRGANLMSNMILDRNHWYHVVAVFKAGKYMRLYIDGKLDSEMTEKVPSKIGRDKKRFRVGGSGKGGYFAGTLTDLHFYNRALEAGEIACLYKSENRFEAKTDNEKAMTEVNPIMQFSNKNMTLNVLPGGAMDIACGDSRYRVGSMYSYPAEPEMKFNNLEAVSAGNEKSWQVKIDKKSDNSFVVNAQGSTLKLQRAVEILADGKVKIYDKFINPTNEDQAVVFYHRITPFAPAKGNHWYLHGQENARSPWDGRLASANPTGFMKFGSKALAFVAEDDIFRCHLQSVVRDRSDGRIDFNYGSAHIGVPAGKSHTLEYTLYLMEGDYFDFINRLRKDWKIPVLTLNGPFGSIRTAAHRSEVYRRLKDDPAAFRKEFERRNMRIVIINPWFNYWDGNIFKDWEDYKKHMQQVIKTLRSVNPEIQVLTPLETYTYCLGEEDFTTPAPDGFEWNKLTPGTVKRIKESPWRDSATYGKYGNMSLYPMSPVPGAVRKYIPLMVHPERGNHFYKLRRKEIAFLLDEVGVDGIYQDMFGFSAPSDIIHHVWDGFSISVLPNGRINEKYTHMGPRTAPARADWLRLILSKGKMALTNFGAPTTRELQTIPYMNFCEAAGKGVGRQNLDVIPPDASGCTMNHLSTPLALGPHRSEEIDAVRLMTRVRAYLRYGTLYVHTSLRNSFPESGPTSGEYGPINHMYPITPIELHRGWVKGKERIVSCVSYTTNWDRMEAPKALRFDAVGREIPVGNAVKITGKPGNWNIEVKIDDWKEFLIIE